MRKIHEESAKHQEEALTQNANFAEDANDQTKAKNIQQQKNAEKKCRAWGQLKFQRGLNNNSKGIDRIEIPFSWPTSETYNEESDQELEDPKTINQTDSSKWKNVSCPKEIEFYLRLRNQRHFGQAEIDGTPFTSPSMKRKFDWAASTDEAELTLSGEYSDNECDDIQQLYLDNLKRVTDKKAATRFITESEFKGKIKVWRETTSTSPSGRHLGHYKVLYSTVDRSLDPPMQQKLRDIQSDI